MEEWRELLTVSPGFIAAHETFGARWENEVVGFYALVRSDRETFALEHLWLLPKAMGHGIGRALFAHAVARAAALGALSLTIEADEHAEGFYLRMGALRSGVRESQVAGRPRLLPLLRFSFPASRS